MQRKELPRLHSLSWQFFFWCFVAYPDACAVWRRLSRSFYCCFWCCLVGGCMVSEHIDEWAKPPNTHTRTRKISCSKCTKILKCEFFFFARLLLISFRSLCNACSMCRIDVEFSLLLPSFSFTYFFLLFLFPFFFRCVLFFRPRIFVWYKFRAGFVQMILSVSMHLRLTACWRVECWRISLCECVQGKRTRANITSEYM